MKKNKIMICDDDQSILDVLQMLLESEDFEVIAEIDSTQLINKMQTYSPDYFASRPLDACFNRR